jgi:hypothetical protein
LQIGAAAENVFQMAHGAALAGGIVLVQRPRHFFAQRSETRQTEEAEDLAQDEDERR